MTLQHWELPALKRTKFVTDFYSTRTGEYERRKVMSSVIEAKKKFLLNLAKCPEIDHLFFIMNSEQMRDVLKPMLELGCTQLTKRVLNYAGSYLALFHLDCRDAKKKKRGWKSIQSYSGYTEKSFYTSCGNSNIQGQKGMVLRAFGVPSCCGARCYLYTKDSKWNKKIKFLARKPLEMYIVPVEVATDEFVKAGKLNLMTDYEHDGYRMYWSSYRILSVDDRTLADYTHRNLGKLPKPKKGKGQVTIDANW